jgi:phage gpG-like protein
MKEFNSPGAFARHLVRLAAIAPEVDHHITEKSAEEIQKTAAGMIGQYQEGVGPFPKWEELADSTEQEKARLGYSLDAPLLRDGTLKASIKQTTVGSEAVIGSSNPLMVYHELGTEHIPPRPALGPAAIHSEPRIRRIAGGTVVAWLSGVGWRRARKVTGG